MSVQALHPPALAGCVDAAHDAVHAALEVPTGLLTHQDLERGLCEVVALESRVAALRLRLLAEAEARAVADEDGSTGTDAWAARLTGTRRAVMAGGIWLAGLLEEKYAATREAFAAGGLTEDQVRVIVRAAERLPVWLTEDQRRRTEEALVARAVDEGLDARRLRQVARRMVEVVSAETADQAEAEQLAEEEGRAELLGTWLSLHDRGDGTYEGRFVVPELHGALLAQALERLTAPRRLSRNRAGDEVEDESMPGQLYQLGWTERLGHAFTELIEHLPTDGFAASTVGVLVRIDLETLMGRLAAAHLDCGTAISPGAARRLACSAGIIPAVLGGASEPLDVGRRMRLAPEGIKRALALRHDTCAVEGCERPFAWCEIHHRTPWSAGGGTSLDNSIPLCGHHHRRVHDGDFDVEPRPDHEIALRRRRRRRT